MTNKNEYKKFSKKTKITFFGIWGAQVLIFVIMPAAGYQEASIFASAMFAALLALSAFVLTVIISSFVDLE